MNSAERDLYELHESNIQEFEKLLRIPGWNIDEREDFKNFHPLAVQLISTINKFLKKRATETRIDPETVLDGVAYSYNKNSPHIFYLSVDRSDTLIEISPIEMDVVAMKVFKQLPCIYFRDDEDAYFYKFELPVKVPR